eukprot:CAMPEP_0178421842 /NCGR_PEP_ID=MMETSP0689_2-20121128/26860_1 /TAXON_ID=160604 /ORGANISM="Amphidinium massartii, Strain CS-259" /LENGTH=383 /DNA_ID=CAMNT_0020043375 /DNA_START=75 /DNA_END=1222 /DNA_ORIENTATION=-
MGSFDDSSCAGLRDELTLAFPPDAPCSCGGGSTERGGPLRRGGSEPPLIPIPYHSASPQQRACAASAASQHPAPTDSLTAGLRKRLTSDESPAAKALVAAASSRCDLERQLQQWRKERKEKAQHESPIFAPPGSRMESRQASAAPSAGSFSSNARPQPTDHMPQFGGGLGASGHGVVSVATSEIHESQPVGEASALRRLIAGMRTAIADRQQELEQLQRPQGAGVFSDNSDCDDDGEDDGYSSDATYDMHAAGASTTLPSGLPAHEAASSLRKEMHDQEMLQAERTAERLEGAIADADARIATLEMRLANAQAQTQASTSARSSAAASTAVRIPGNSHLGGDDLWQERAMALEREISAESSVALELQDRVHWLRAQLRKQPLA